MLLLNVTLSFQLLLLIRFIHICNLYTLLFPFYEERYITLEDRNTEKGNQRNYGDVNV